MKKTRHFTRYAPLLFLAAAFLLFFIKGLIALDPDFGWHLKMGEYILRHGIPKTDPFSYSMPSYPFVDHEYLTNIIFALVYPVTGMAGLALVFAGLAVIPLVRPARSVKLIPLLGLAAGTLVVFAGVRPQVITWVMAWIFFTLLRRKPSLRILFLLVFLQAVWVNLHGGFFLGLVFSGLFILTETLKERRIKPSLFLYGGAAALATLANPYGWRVWWEVWMQLSDQSLRWTVQEWLPAFALIDAAFWFYLGVVLGFFIKFRRRVPRYEQAALVLFLAAGLSSMRNIPLWIMVSFPVLEECFLALEAAIPRVPEAGRRFFLFLRAFSIGAAIVLLFQLGVDGFSLGQFTEAGGYPGRAVAFIEAKHLSGNILASYDWGGYLIWKAPERRVFMDGRMPSWRRPSAPAGESSYAYRDYRTILSQGPGWEAMLRKYRISYLLLRPPVSAGGLFAPKKPKIPFVGMKIIYRDKVSVLYRTGI